MPLYLIKFNHRPNPLFLSQFFNKVKNEITYLLMAINEATGNKSRRIKGSRHDLPMSALKESWWDIF